MTRLRIVAALTAALVLLVASPAAAHTTPLPGETLPALVKRTCGTSAGWQDQAARNGIATTGPRAYWVYLGRSYDIRCGSPTGTSATPSSSQGWRTPVDLTCFPNYGGRVFGAPRSGHVHQGVDLGPVSGVYRGEPVYAVAAGTIIAAGASGNAGLRVNIRHGDGSVTKAFHLGQIARWSGTVNAGTVIGYVGDTGNAAVSRGGGGPHLHWESHVGGRAVNPVGYLSARGVSIACR